MIKTGELKMNI